MRSETHLWLMDMDGVLVHEDRAVAGADSFVAALREHEVPFLVLTNNSMYPPRDLSARLQLIGLNVPEDAIWTSALATARLLEQQRPRGSAFVIGEAGVTTALYEAGSVPTACQNSDDKRRNRRRSRCGEVTDVADIVDVKPGERELLHPLSVRRDKPNYIEL